MSIPQQTELYRSDQLVARFVGSADHNVCVVTFTSYTDSHTLDRAGFGEQFFEKRGIDAIHVISKGNAWYLYQDVRRLCATVASVTRPYRRVATYGSSMGGYAAIRLGSLVGADVAIALSPQFTIDPRSAPFETRWMEASVLDFSIEADLDATPFAPVSCIAYDPFDQDRLHVDLFDLHTTVRRIALPFSGHPSSGFLQQTGLLSELVLGVLDETFDLAPFKKEARRRRGTSADYFLALAERCRSPRLRVALASRAVALTNDNADYVARQCWYQALAGDHDRALARLRSLVAVPGAPARAYYFLSCVEELRGNLEQAIATMDELIAAFSASHHHQARRDLLAEKLEERTRRPARLVDRATSLLSKWRLGAHALTMVDPHREQADRGGHHPESN